MKRQLAIISLSTLSGTIAAYFGDYIPLLIVVAIAVIFDFISGVCAALITEQGWSSKIARKGVIKKASLFLALGFGIFLDYMIPLAGEKIGITIASQLLFSSIIAFYIVFTECVSIAENIYKCDPVHFPKWISKILEEGKKQIEKIGKGDDDDDESTSNRNV